MSIGIWQIAIVVILVVLLFGRGKISSLMGDVAKGIKSFKKGMASDVTDESRSSSINVYNSFQNSSNKMKFNIHNGSTSAPTRTTVMTLTGEGRVSIGAASPSEKLHVGGNIKADGTVIGASSNFGSDDRLKHNEEDISDSLKDQSRL